MTGNVGRGGWGADRSMLRAGERVRLVARDVK